MPLSLQTVNGIHLAALSGGLDSSSGSDLVTSIKASVEKGASIILDCTLVPQLDVAGFRHLLALHRWSQMGNGRLILAGMVPEAWVLIVENHCENTFESKSSVAAAFQSLGVNSQNESEAPSQKTSLADDFVSMDVSPPPLSEGDSGIFNMPKGPAAESNPWASSTVSDSDNEGWDGFSKRHPPPSSETENVRKSKQRTPLILGVTVVAAGLIIGFSLWVMSFLRVPEVPVITIEGETLIEVSEGQELPEVRIMVSNGNLDLGATDLPKGIDFSVEVESDRNSEYSLVGVPKKAGTYVVSLTASRESRKSERVKISIEVKERKLEWLFAQPPMQENVLIKSSNYAKVVTGAQKLDLRWIGEGPEGLQVNEIEGVDGTWQISGIPSKGGNFHAEFIATTKSGRSETKIFVINVMKAPGVPPPGVPPPGVPPPGVPPPGVPPPGVPPLVVEPALGMPPPTQSVDDGMRTFLLERIEKANSHFTDVEKGMLRDIVGRLSEAKLVTTIHFGNGQTRLSSSEEKEMKSMLKKPDIDKLLNDPNCQLLVVGYASNTGGHAMNVKLSQQRAKAVNDLLRSEIGRGADLCGDYGPTDIISSDESGNRVVEVFAGTIKMSKAEKSLADMFKNDFNKRHGERP